MNLKVKPVSAEPVFERLQIFHDIPAGRNGANQQQAQREQSYTRERGRKDGKCGQVNKYDQVAGENSSPAAAGSVLMNAVIWQFPDRTAFRHLTTHSAARRRQLLQAEQYHLAEITSTVVA